MKTLLLGVVLSTALMIPATSFAAGGQDHHDGYYDKHHKDYHQWNDHEDRAWRMYQNEHHHKYVDWQRARDRDRQNYWAWRHNHSDSILKIDIR